MPRQSSSVVENNFTKGKITEFTGLNFPENAAIEDDNCIFTRTGLVLRRPGIDFEDSYLGVPIGNNDFAKSSFYWKNVAGDGSTDVYVTQVGQYLRFWDVSTPDKANSISNNLFSSFVDIFDYLPPGSPYTTAQVAATECQYTFGFGYLFVFHPYLDTIYVSYDSGTFTASNIAVKIRDIPGIDEGLADDFRALTLTNNHQYNLLNQGWGSTPSWSASSTSSVTVGTGNKTFTVSAGLSITGGDIVTINTTAPVLGPPMAAMTGAVFSYVGTTLVITVTTANPVITGVAYSDWVLESQSSGYIDTFFSDTATYPSNADQWWRFKDSTGVYSPSTTAGQVTLSTAPAPKGHYILEAFNQQKSIVSGVAVTDESTYARPSTGCWAAGRVWYTGVNAKGLNNKVYFSQIIEKTAQFGSCFQSNDPTSELFFDLLPSDGGVIGIYDAETIHRIIPYKNTLLVFASNGIWTISGSTGVGFTAIDYALHKLEDAVPTLSHTSFVDVQGTPMWWNNEGIYTLGIKEQNIKVDSITHSTIASFYNDIPALSRKFARGAYNKTDFIVQWLYRDTEATTVNETYEYNKILNLNTITGAFYSWSLAESTPTVNGVVVLDSNGDLTTENTLVEPVFKYLTSYGNTFTFSEFNNLDFLDWETYGEDIDYSSYFITGYKIYGDAQRKFQTNYVNVFSEGTQDTSYGIQGIWDYANTGNTGQFTSISRSNLTDTGYNYVKRRYKIRGHGLACQFKFTSVEGEPFRLVGWSVWNSVNAAP